MLTDDMRREGWIEHDGGPCPVDGDDVVKVMFADGTTDTICAGFWSADEPDMDDMWTGECWPEDRIIAYLPENPNGQ